MDNYEDCYEEMCDRRELPGMDADLAEEEIQKRRELDRYRVLRGNPHFYDEYWKHETEPRHLYWRDVDYKEVY